jgi:hypothetical protein
MEVELHERPI